MDSSPPLTYAQRQAHLELLDRFIAIGQWVDYGVMGMIEPAIVIDAVGRLTQAAARWALVAEAAAA